MALIRTGSKPIQYAITKISNVTVAQTITCNAGDTIYISTNDNRSTYSGLTQVSLETSDYNQAGIYTATGSSFTVTPYNASTVVFIYKPV